MTTEIPSADEPYFEWAELREKLKANDILTYYAVHSDGHHDGWKGLTQLLRDKIVDHMDKIRAMMEIESDEVLSAKLRGRINGLRDTLQIITESNQ